MKIEHVLFPSVFFKITDPFDGRSFLMCSHNPFFGTNKNGILKNGSCEQALKLSLSMRSQPNINRLGPKGGLNFPKKNSSNYLNGSS